jgi:hypothetical protein
MIEFWAFWGSSKVMFISLISLMAVVVCVVVYGLLLFEYLVNVYEILSLS